MTVEKVTNLLNSFGLSVVENIGNLFKIKFSTDVEGNGEVFSIHIPLVTKRNTLSYNNIDEISNPILAVLPKELAQDEKLSAIEAWYLMKRRPKDWDQYMKHVYGTWLSTRKTIIAGFAKSIPDDAWVARASEAIEVELYRGLAQDIKRAERPGFNGFNATNGSIQHFLSKYCVFGTTPTNASQGRIIFNVEIPENVTSPGNLVDLASIPQDTDAPQRMHVFQGVQVVDNKLVRTKKFSSGSYVLNATPLRAFLSEKRMVVQRAADQALPLRKRQRPLVRNLGGSMLNGINAIVLRSDEAPTDGYIISKSFAAQLWASRSVKKTYRLPNNTNVVNLFKPITKEEIAMSLNLGLQPPRIRPGKGLFQYSRHGLGEAVITENVSLQDIMLREKKMIETSAKEFLTPIGTMTTKGWDRTPCTIHQIDGIQLIDAKIGTKLMDMFGNKGTVSEIRNDEDMPIVHINEEEGYRVQVIYNPNIYKRKVAFSYKMAGLLGLQEYLREDIPEHKKRVVLNPEASAAEILQLARERKTPRFHTITYKDETFKSAKASLQFFLHLDQDPERKFKHSTTERCRLTLIDRGYLKKMGFNIKSNFTKPNEIGKVIGIRAEIKDDVPVFKGVEVNPDAFPDAFQINKRLDRRYLKSDIGTLNSSAVEDTVADPRLKDQPGYIETDFGRIYAPANIFSSLVNHKNSMILPSELITLNAILSEQVSVNWLNSMIRKATESGKPDDLASIPMYRKKVNLGRQKTRSLIDQYYSKVMGRFANEVSQAYNYRIPGIFGVASANNNLPMDTVGIPRFVWNRLKKFSNTHGIFRRHPIHRVYNCMPVKLVPTDGFTIQINEKLMKLSDGDFDGDPVEILFMSPKQVDVFSKYNPQRLELGWNDIKLKKFSRREARTSNLAYDQKYLKQYTAFSGAIAIELSERARAAGYGHTQVAQLYHYAAQTALNIKHRRDGIQLINRLSEHFLKDRPMKVGEFIDICMKINPNFTDKDVRKLRGLFATKKTDRLLLTRNKINKKAMEFLRKVSTVKIGMLEYQEEDENPEALAEAHFSY